MGRGAARQRVGQPTERDAVGDERGEPSLDAVGRVPLDEFVGERREPPDVVADQCLDERITRREVAVQGADPDAGAASDVVE